MLVQGEPNIAYICSRYYRAPELIFGATDYTPAIDMWSAGCVMAELLLGQPLFPGESSVDQLVEIIKVLGTPTKAELYAMNKNYTEFKFPQVKQYPWTKVFRSRTPPEAIDLLARILCYTPEHRLKPLEACAHPFFDELRGAEVTSFLCSLAIVCRLSAAVLSLTNSLFSDPSFRLPDGRAPPPLFNFTEQELKEAGPLLAKLQPKMPAAVASTGDSASTV
eukprot:SAG31_NODE_4_length_45662_cov_15.654622_13_plen_221_part_00